MILFYFDIVTWLKSNRIKLRFLEASIEFGYFLFVLDKLSLNDFAEYLLKLNFIVDHTGIFTYLDTCM